MPPLFDHSLLSIALFVFAGILIGHLLWYRDRSADEARIGDLETRYIKARSVARQRRQQRLAAVRRVAELEQLAEHSRNHTAELERREQSLAEAVASENRRSESLKAQLREVLQAKTEQERLTSDQARSHEELQHAYARMETELAALQAQRAAEWEILPSDHPKTSVERSESSEQIVVALQHRLAQAELERRQSAATLEQTQLDLAARCHDLDEVRAEHDAVVEELKQTVERVTSAETELAEAAAVNGEYQQLAEQLEAAAQTLFEQRELLRQRQQQLNDAHERLEEQVVQLGQGRSHQQALEELIHDREQQLVRVTEQLTTLSQESADAELVLQSLHERLAAVEAEKQALKKTVAQFDADLKTAAESYERDVQAADQRLVEEQQRRLRIQDQLDQREAELRSRANSSDALETETLRTALQSYETMQADLSDTTERLSEASLLFNELKVRFDDQSEQLQQARQAWTQSQADRQRLEESLQRQEREVAALSQQCDEQAASIRQLEQSNTTLVAERDTLRIGHQREIEDLQARFQYQLDDLTRRKSEIENLRGELALFEASKREIERYAEQLQSRTEECESLIDAKGQLELRIVALQDQVSGQRVTIERLQTELQSVSRKETESQRRVRPEDDRDSDTRRAA